MEACIRAYRDHFHGAGHYGGGGGEETCSWTRAEVVRVGRARGKGAIATVTTVTAFELGLWTPR